MERKNARGGNQNVMGKIRDYQGERKAQEAKEETTGSRRKIKGVDRAKGVKCMRGEMSRGKWRITERKK